jgi:hypothetical protein
MSYAALAVRGAALDEAAKGALTTLQQSGDKGAFSRVWDKVKEATGLASPSLITDQNAMAALAAILESMSGHEEVANLVMESLGSSKHLSGVEKIAIFRGMISAQQDAIAEDKKDIDGIYDGKAGVEAVAVLREQAVMAARHLGCASLSELVEVLTIVRRISIDEIDMVISVSEGLSNQKHRGVLLS